MARQAMLRAVNRELKTFPPEVQECATAELARQLAREFDAGDRPAANPLMTALRELRKLAAPATSKASAPAQPTEQEDGPDVVDELARMRADRLAGAAGVVRPIRGDQRRSGGAGAG